MTDALSYGKTMAPQGYVSVKPLPSKEELAKFYADVYYQQQPSATYQAEYSDDELAQRRLRAALIVHAVTAARGCDAGGAAFFEIGCGEGFLLAAALQAGFEATGLDFSSFGVSKFHPALVERVRLGDASDLLDQMKADGLRVEVCVLQNVIEHVRDPIGLLDRVKAVLQPGGLALVTVPNDYSRLQQRAMELGLANYEYWFAPPQHLHYFNVDNLRKFAESLGFEVIDAFADFPIELYLFHPESNYVLNRERGKGAHRARIVLDLLLAERGLAPYHRLCQAMTACGMGRNVSVILRPRTPR